MFEKSVEELTELGAQITTAEIAQQPELWRDTLNIYRENKEAIEAFLAEARAMGEGRLSVVFTGAGTSDYVGDTCAPYLRHAGNTDLYDFKPIATTDIVSAPRDFLRAEDPTLVVSFARSGNSPESLAAVAVAKELVHNVKFLNITCAPEGSYTSGGMDVIMKDNLCWLADGKSIAGSVLTLAQGVKNIVDWGIASADIAIRMATEVPARSAHIEDKCGSIMPGRDADFVVFDHELTLVETYVGGQSVGNAFTE